VKLAFVPAPWEDKPSADSPLQGSVRLLPCFTPGHQVLLRGLSMLLSPVRREFQNSRPIYPSKVKTLCKGPEPHPPTTPVRAPLPRDSPLWGNSRLALCFHRRGSPQWCFHVFRFAHSGEITVYFQRPFNSLRSAKELPWPSVLLPVLD